VIDILHVLLRDLILLNYYYWCSWFAHRWE